MSENTRIYQRIFKAIGLTLLALFLLVTIVVTIALNSSYVQNRLVDWAGVILENRYNIHLEVDDIDFRPFNRLYVKKMLLSTSAVDSMIYISEGDLSFDANPFKLLRGEFELSKVDGDSVKVRLLSNYTPQLQDTTGGIDIYFLPAEISVRHFDFSLRDTVRHMEVKARSDRIRTRVDASNLKDEFVLEEVDLVNPSVTVYSAQQESGQNPYIKKLLI